jgi:hypothetical protein
MRTLESATLAAVALSGIVFLGNVADFVEDHGVLKAGRSTTTNSNGVQERDLTWVLIPS